MVLLRIYLGPFDRIFSNVFFPGGLRPKGVHSANLWDCLGQNPVTTTGCEPGGPPISPKVWFHYNETILSGFGAGPAAVRPGRSFLDPSGRLLRTSGRLRGADGGHLGAFSGHSLGHPGSTLGPFGSFAAPLGPRSWPSALLWTPLGTTWVIFGCLWYTCGAYKTHILAALRQN